MFQLHVLRMLFSAKYRLRQDSVYLVGTENVSQRNSKVCVVLGSLSEQQCGRLRSERNVGGSWECTPKPDSLLSTIIDSSPGNRCSPE